MERLAIEVVRGVEVDGGPAVYAQPPMNSVEHLIVRARRGDEEAFRLIFERYSRPIISFIYDMIGDRAQAEELTQETFVRAHRHLNSLREEAKFATWLFSIAKNVARESLRTAHSRSHKISLDDDAVQELSDGRPSPAGALLDKELNEVVRRALSGLEEDKRLVFTLKVFQQRSYEEIMAITGFSLPKVKTDLHRARTELRRRIRPYLGVKE